MGPTVQSGSDLLPNYIFIGQTQIKTMGPLLSRLFHLKFGKLFQQIKKKTASHFLLQPIRAIPLKHSMLLFCITFLYSANNLYGIYVLSSYFLTFNIFSCPIGHFRVLLCLCFKTSLSAKLFI